MFHRKKQLLVLLKEMQSAGSSGEFYTPRALTEFMAEIVNPQIGEKMADFACGTGGFHWYITTTR